jgi:transporter family protein
MTNEGDDVMDTSRRSVGGSRRRNCAEAFCYNPRMARWLVWTLATITTWGVWAVLSKMLSDEIPSPAQAQVLSTVGVLPVVVALWLMKEEPASGNQRRGISIALGSGIVSCLGNIAYFDVFNRGTKAAAVIPITALYPAVTVLLAIPLLHERLNRWQAIGIGLSMGAIWLFNVPGVEGAFSSWLLYALIPIVLWGVCGLMQKMSTNDISARTSAIWFLLSFVPVAVLLLMYSGLPEGLTSRTWLLASAVGFTLALGNLTILLAFSSGGKASIIAPLAGLYPLVSIPIAIAVLGEKIGWRESLGIVCALAAVVMLSAQTELQVAPTSALETEPNA